MTLMQVLPLLTEDGVGMRMDWLTARYRTSVAAWRGGASVTNEFIDAVALNQLISDGRAKWVVEIRCPKTLYMKSYTSGESSFDISFDPQDIEGRLFILPGLVAVENLRLTTAELNRELFNEDTVLVPAGAWLAKGKTHENKGLSTSLVEFRKDEELKPGRMRVTPDTGSGDLRFIIHLAPDLWTRRESRDVQVAGLIAACARLPQFEGEPDDPVNSLLLQVKEYLDNEGVATWDNKDEWDPALAATAIERFISEEVDGA